MATFGLKQLRNPRPRPGTTSPGAPGASPPPADGSTPPARNPR